LKVSEELERVEPWVPFAHPRGADDVQALRRRIDRAVVVLERDRQREVVQDGKAQCGEVERASVHRLVPVRLVVVGVERVDEFELLLAGFLIHIDLWLDVEGAAGFPFVEVRFHSE
jgi:hypothetical protein